MLELKLTNRRKVMVRKPMNFSERIYLPAVFKGMAITLSHLFRKKANIQYTEQQRPMSQVFRGLQILKRDEKSAERCTACGLCALACPAEAITMTAAERTPDNKQFYREEKYASVYEINMLRCIFCGLCEEACPKAAIFLQNDVMAPASYEREDFIYGKDRLVEPFLQN